MTTPQQPQSKDWNKELRRVLTDELFTAFALATALQPNSDAEFVAITLPNLHIKMHELFATLLVEERSRIGERLDKLVMSEKYKGDTMLDLDDIKALLDTRPTDTKCV